MARYSLGFQSVTTTASGFADSTSYVNSGYPFFLQLPNTTNYNAKINEIFCSGESTANAFVFLVLGLDIVFASGTFSGCYTGLGDGTATAPSNLFSYGNSSTNARPQRWGSLGRFLQHSFNAYGGSVKWQARPNEEIIFTANSVREISYSPYTGSQSGIVSGHCLFEVI